LRARLREDPARAEPYLQLARLYRDSGQLEPAHEVLREGLDATGNPFELAVELADLEVEPFRRNLAITEEKLRAAPDDPHLGKIHAQLRKEVNTRELDIFRRQADRYPTELAHRYELGVRLLRAGQLDEAIHELQTARADPRFRWRALLHLGRCFQERHNPRLALRNFAEALQHLPAGEGEARKELLFELAQASAEAGDFAEAVRHAAELAGIDPAYGGVAALLEQWQAILRQTRIAQ
jgi:tetratricopeptide (TPR) repeat protein